MWPLIRRGVPAFTVGEQCDKGLVLRRSILKFHVALCTCLSYWTWVFSSIKNDCLSFTMGISWEKIRKAPSTMPDKLYVLDLIVAVIYFWPPCEKNTGFPGDSGVKNLLANAGHVGSTPGSGRSPGRGHGDPLQYSCLESPMDRGAWQATVHEVAKGWTWIKWLSTHICIKTMYFLFMLKCYGCCSTQPSTSA